MTTYSINSETDKKIFYGSFKFHKLGMFSDVALTPTQGANNGALQELAVW